MPYCCQPSGRCPQSAARCCPSGPSGPSGPSVLAVPFGWLFALPGKLPRLSGSEILLPPFNSTSGAHLCSHHHDLTLHRHSPPNRPTALSITAPYDSRPTTLFWTSSHHAETTSSPRKRKGLRCPPLFPRYSPSTFGQTSQNHHCA